MNWYGNIKFILAFLCFSLAVAFRINRLKFSNTKPLFSIDDWLLKSADAESDVKVVTVRFINNLSGKDVITEAEEGTILLAVGDRAGVKLPRACRTGLCGSCTCEVQDPQAIATDTNPREGFATIRACSTRCYVPEGMDEMVVDVHRMRARTTAGATSKGTGSSSGINSPVEASYVSVFYHLKNSIMRLFLLFNTNIYNYYN